MARTLVDSDYLIDALRDAPGVAQKLAARAASEPIAMATVTLFEVSRGLRTDRARERFSRIVERIEVLAVDRSAAEAAAEVWKAVRAAGTPVDRGDLLIAGVAISQGLPLLTRNRRDFDRIPGLTVLEL